MGNINILHDIGDDKWNIDKNINFIFNNEYLSNIFYKFIINSYLKENYNNNLNIEISLLFTDNINIKSLNNKYRKKNKETNILSFHIINNKNEITEHIIDNNLFLGDIILAYDFIKDEATLDNKSFLNHVIHLLLHSYLHLIGYNHADDKEALIMENKEIFILEKEFNINNPYI